MRSLFESTDVLFLQETWLYDTESDILNSVLPNCRHYCVSAMDDTDVVRLGRPHGGVAIGWKASLGLTIDSINVQNNRICAIKVVCNGTNYIFISIYMPVNNESFVSYREYGDVLNEISGLMQIYDDFLFVIGGDFNVNFGNQTSANKELLLQFIEDEDLQCISQVLDHDVVFTFESSLGNKSFIDNFLISKELYGNVSNFKVIIDGSNLSDHYPIQCSVKCNSFTVFENNFKNNVHWINDWNSATVNQIDHYKFVLNQVLDTLDFDFNVFSCNDFNCSDHSNAITAHLDKIVNSMILASDIAIPKRKITNKLGVPGWNDQVKPFKEKSILWTNIWKDAGCPSLLIYAKNQKTHDYKNLSKRLRKKRTI